MNPSQRRLRTASSTWVKVKTDAKKLNLIFCVIALVALLLAWLAAYAGTRDPTIVPSPWETIREAGRLMGGGEFWLAFGGTLLRTLLAFAISLVMGTALAVLASVHRFIRAFLAPIISVLRTLPTMAIVLILIILTGYNYAAVPVLIGLLVLLPVLYAAALASIDEVGKKYGMVSENFHVGTAKKIFWMYIPLAAPPVLAQTGPVFSLGLKIVVSGEVLAQTATSLGFMMQNAAVYTDISQLFALTLLCVLTGFLLEGLCALIKKIVLRWEK